MLSNRSIQRATVIPVLAYPDVNQAADWLCAAFGFTVRLRIGTHRVQLNVGDGALTLRELRENERAEALGSGHSITIRVDDYAGTGDPHVWRAAIQRRGFRRTLVDTFAVGCRRGSEGVGRHSRTALTAILRPSAPQAGGNAGLLLSTSSSRTTAARSPGCGTCWSFSASWARGRHRGSSSF